ncbi:MAG TPA: chemotaxis protein CheB [Urbifossiella sp.]|nr:chemotaxis protein CheB [Urbifossiella sp.]
MAKHSGNRAGDRDGAEGASGAERLTAPPDEGRTPRLPFPVVGIGASAGGLEAFSEFLQACPADAGMAYVLIQHLPPDRESLLTELLARQTVMPVVQVEDGQPVEPNYVYVIRPGHTLTIGDGRLHLGPELAARGHGRPVDDFFRSLAEEQQQRAVAVVFSGMGSNGTAGAQVVKAVGGLVIAQEPDSAKFQSMPRSLIDAHLPDFILRPAEVPDALIKYAGQPYVADDHAAVAPPAPKDEQALADVLAVLRTRTRHDFSGYRKPTLLRRVRRRMGIGMYASPADYVRALRQTPAEVTALADDLLIHVTGFFRDPEAWDALRAKVIEPLAADRADGAEVRCWVSACATGEEAYTLAMLLVEAAEARGKKFDVKIFATDMAERALGHARTGVFPNGIESEVSPERLARFFEKDDSFYQVRKELRELVIFAPQNILQDPPFSRLDVASCRNLLIYLEPATQARVLSVLHFGLREGGALMLGSSESIAPSEGDFEAIDKKHRLFRRVGPTRTGTLDLPALSAAAREMRPVAPAPGRAGVPPAAAHLVNRALLDRHTPPAVAVDAAGQVVHVHGDTGRYLTVPPGGPTMELLALANDQVRGAVRAALHRAADTHASVTVRDGLMDTPEGRRRVEVVAAPLGPRGAPALYLVTFHDHPEVPAAVATASGATAADMAEELRRTRNELQGALEEMQSTNEELKASHEESTSLNEELQSTNEELETSKEELQSLNEELVTVNAQLQAKMSELEASANDLASLLASADIAVLFLDPRFRIRRYTPATRDLFELIPGDIGRPLTDLRRKFADPELVADAQTVLDRLVPIEREVTSESGRSYLRRVLPYRTQDNRIEGVVIAFVDVSAVRASEARLRAVAANLPNGAVFVVDRGLRYVLAAGKALAPAGLTPADLEGKTLAEALPPALAAEYAALYRRALAGEPFRAEHDGNGRHYVTHGVPLRDAGGAVTAALAVSYDITDRKEAEEAVRLAERRLRLALAAARMGIWTLDTANGTQVRDDNLNRLLGLDPVETAQPFEEFFDHIHPADHDRVRAAFAESAREGHPLNIEFRVVRPDGTVRWLRDQGDVFGDAAAGRQVMAGACVDVTERVEAEAAVRVSEERLRQIVASATDYAILTLDDDRVVTSWSPGAAATFGYSADEMIGRSCDDLFTPEDRAAGGPEQEADTARREGRAADERWHVRKDGSRFYASGVLTRLAAGGFVKVARDLTDRKRAEDELRAARDLLEQRVAERTAELSGAVEALEAEMIRRREVAQRLTTAQEDERKRVSRDLHDTVGQTHAALTLSLRAAAAAVPVRGEAADRLAYAAGLAEAMGRELHEAAVRLRPTALDDIGLGPAVAELVTKWSTRTGVAAEYRSAELEGGRLPADVETALYRVVQEALTNVARHARAKAVSVTVGRAGGEARAVVEDDGVGFDPEAGTIRLGLAGMRERVELVGGALEIESAPGAGTTVIARVPVA